MKYRSNIAFYYSSINNIIFNYIFILPSIFNDENKISLLSFFNKNKVNYNTDL